MDTREIIRVAGGPLKVGKAIGRHHTTVSAWLRIPAEHVLAIARMAAISPHVIRPDVFGPEPQPCAQQPSVPWWELPNAQAGQRGAA